MPLKLYNTLTRKKEIFKPIKGKKVGLYTCGPTVYDFAHLGNLRTYIFEDVLRRVLEYNGFKVKHVMNITDVGHLTSDADIGEDKMLVGARREKKTVWEIAKRYTQAFKKDIKKLNILEPHIWCKATDHIKEQIELIKKLEKKGFTYKTKDGVYFDTSKFPTYGALVKLKSKKLKPKARIKLGATKKHPQDFALWKFSRGQKKRLMEWKSPWGVGFPGWHLECSAMSMKYLGEHFDIHAGAIDHIPIHHTNEIAQSEAATGKKFVNFWIHGEHLLVNNKKMAKSESNYITLNKLIEKKINPLAFRYLVLTSHYRSKLNFTWKSVQAAQNALFNLYDKIKKLNTSFSTSTNRNRISHYEKKFLAAVNNDLDTPAALVLVWDLLRSSFAPNLIQKTLLKFDQVLGLNFAKAIKEKIVIPLKIKRLVAEREKARTSKNWEKADLLREKIKKKGYIIEDTPSGPRIIKKAK